MQLIYFSQNHFNNGLGMRKKYILNVMIFTFAVMIVLCRPFFVYQLATNPKFPKEPYKIERLLRALIKKKNDHSGDTEEVMELKTSRKYIPLLVFFTLLFNKSLLLLAVLFSLPLILYRRTVFHVAPTNRYYQFICCFQI